MKDQDQQLFTLLNSSEIQLVPYVESSQGWTLPDEVLFYIVSLAEKNGVFQTTFYDGTVNSAEEFVAAMKDPSNYPVFAFSGDEPQGFAWLNEVHGNRAFAHFCSLQASWGGMAEKSGRLVLRYWLGMSPSTEFILGMIPGSNTLALRFIEKLGFKRVGEIPNMILNLGDRDSSVFSYYSRFDHA